jgi:hypothetical protein
MRTLAGILAVSVVASLLVACTKNGARDTPGNALVGIYLHIDDHQYGPVYSALCRSLRSSITRADFIQRHGGDVSDALLDGPVATGFNERAESADDATARGSVTIDFTVAPLNHLSSWRARMVQVGRSWKLCGLNRLPQPGFDTSPS